MKKISFYCTKCCIQRHTKVVCRMREMQRKIGWGTSNRVQNKNQQGGKGKTSEKEETSEKEGEKEKVTLEADGVLGGVEKEGKKQHMKDQAMSLVAVEVADGVSLEEEKEPVTEQQMALVTDGAVEMQGIDSAMKEYYVEEDLMNPPQYKTWL